VPEGVRLQSVEIGEVANRLVALAEGEPLRATEEMGGPEILALEDMANTYLRVRGRTAQAHPAAISGSPWDGFRNPAILTPDHAAGVVTWEQYLHHEVVG
jgi:uncharacterized protein YbjT (DUF2867 family)